MKSWSFLNENREILNQVENNWVSLMADPKNAEEVYHQFLAKHSGLFFGHPYNCFACISKLNLGDDFQTDFILPLERASYGFSYEFIEIETPHEKLFTQKNLQTQRLQTAIKQVNDWKTWLFNNNDQTRRLFPSKSLNAYGKPDFRFTIYIGRRNELEEKNMERISLEKAHQIEIRSFDSLTDKLRKRYFSNEPLICSSEADGLSDKHKNELVNPFFEAFSGKDWKEIVTNPKFELVHMYASNIDLILKKRNYNEYIDKVP